MPIRRSPASRSVPAVKSASTRVMIDPTVRQAMRSSSQTADLLVTTAIQATVSSKSRVCPA